MTDPIGFGSLTLKGLQNHLRESDGKIDARFDDEGTLQIYSGKKSASLPKTASEKAAAFDRQQLAALALHQAISNTHGSAVADLILRGLGDRLQRSGTDIDADFLEEVAVHAAVFAADLSSPEAPKPPAIQAKGVSAQDIEEDDDFEVLKDLYHPGYASSGQAWQSPAPAPSGQSGVASAAAPSPAKSQRQVGNRAAGEAFLKQNPVNLLLPDAADADQEQRREAVLGSFLPKAGAPNDFGLSAKGAEESVLHAFENFDGDAGSLGPYEKEALATEALAQYLGFDAQESAPSVQAAGPQRPAGVVDRAPVTEETKRLARQQAKAYLRETRFDDLMYAARGDHHKAADKLGPRSGFPISGDFNGVSLAGARDAVARAIADHVVEHHQPDAGPNPFLDLPEAQKEKVAVDALRAYLAWPQASAD